MNWMNTSSRLVSPGATVVSLRVSNGASVFSNTARSEATQRALSLDGDKQVIRNLEKWLQLDRVVGRDLPIVPPREK